MAQAPKQRQINHPSCRICSKPRPAFYDGLGIMHRLCVFCDMGHTGPGQGPPILLRYLRDGHR